MLVAHDVPQKIATTFVNGMMLLLSIIDETIGGKDHNQVAGVGWGGGSDQES